MKTLHHLFSRVLGAAVVGIATSHAATIAYWRFEDQPNGGYLVGTTGDMNPATYTVTEDSSGNGNSLRTFNSPPNQSSPLQTSGQFVSNVPGSSIPQTGASNDRSVVFAGAQDFYTVPGTQIIETTIGGDFTIETSFLSTASGQDWHTILGKDRGPNPGQPGRFFYQLSAITGGLRISLDDSSETTRIIDPGWIPQTNVWYNTALVSRGNTLTLYVQNPDSTWGVIGTSDTSGGLYDTPAVWSVGRGWYGGAVDFWQGGIDEIRISNTALNPDQFLWSVPEPSTWAVTVLGCGILFVVGRRRRTV